MKKKSIYLLLITVLFSACGDNEDTTPVDLRDPMVGTYTYEDTERYADGTVEVYTGTISVEKSPTSDHIVFFEDGEVIGRGDKLREASNGIVFDLQDTRETIEGDLWESKGIDLIELGSTNYHGVFEEAEDKIGLAFETLVNGTREFTNIYVLTKI